MQNWVGNKQGKGAKVFSWLLKKLRTSYKTCFLLFTLKNTTGFIQNNCINKWFLIPSFQKIACQKSTRKCENVLLISQAFLFIINSQTKKTMLQLGIGSPTKIGHAQNGWVHFIFCTEE